MDEMNKNMEPGTTDSNQSEKETESQVEVKIWKKPDTGRKKRYVYEVVAEEPEEKSGEAVRQNGDSGSGPETVPHQENGPETVPHQENGPETVPRQESGSVVMPENRNKEGRFSGKRSERKQAKRTGTGRSESGKKKKKKENLLEKDNISKKAKRCD